MKTSNPMIETDNLVLFPSSKNFAENVAKDLDIEDPMMDLLNEYADISDEDIPSHLDDKFFEALEEEKEEMSFESLEAFMGRHQKPATLTHDDRLVMLIKERMNDIAEAKARIKFYLDEIEMFLPRRR